MSSDIINEFKILKAFLVDLYPRSPYLIIQVDWIPPPQRRWIKGNTYGSAKGALGSGVAQGFERLKANLRMRPKAELEDNKENINKRKTFGLL